MGLENVLNMRTICMYNICTYCIQYVYTYIHMDVRTLLIPLQPSNCLAIPRHIILCKSPNKTDLRQSTPAGARSNGAAEALLLGRSQKERDREGGRERGRETNLGLTRESKVLAEKAAQYAPVTAVVLLCRSRCRCRCRCPPSFGLGHCAVLRCSVRITHAPGGQT